MTWDHGDWGRADASRQRGAISRGDSGPAIALLERDTLGEDFNILLVSRLRQEVAVHGAVEGVARAVGRTGGVIISCTLV